MGLAEELGPLLFYQDTEPTTKRWNNVLIASVALFIILIISLNGAEAFAKVNGLVFAIQFGAILCALASMWFRSSPLQLKYGSLESPSFERLMENAFSDYSIDAKCGNKLCSTNIIFGILYNAMTGIMEGANLSGDLKSPRTSIPVGTLYAVATACILYVILILTFASSFSRDTLKGNPNVMEESTFPSSYVVTIGICVASFSAALNSMFGAARVLQALGKDDLPPGMGLSFFAKGSLHGNEPQRAVLFTWLIAQLAAFVGDLDAISPVIAAFFLFSYATVNLTTFLLDISGTPNFRPQFKYFSRSQSFSGFILCLAICFYLNVWYACISCFIMFGLSVYIAYSAPNKSWGDVSKSIMYHQIRKYLLLLDDVEHVKHWRPSLLLLVAHSDINTELVTFCNILKKGGLFCLGNALQGKVNTALVFQMREKLLFDAKQMNVKAVPEVTMSSSIRAGFQQLAMLAGVGALKPNTIVLPFPRSFGFVSDQDSCSLENIGGNPAFIIPSEFLGFIQDVLSLKRNLVLACNFDTPFQDSYQRDFSNKKIDVWVVGLHLDLGGSLSLQLQLANILYTTQQGSSIRLLNIVDENVDTEIQRDALAELERDCRMNFEICVVRSTDSKSVQEMNHLILSHSKQTAFTFLSLDSFLKMNDAVDVLNILLKGLPTSMLVASGTGVNIIPQSL